VKKLLQREKLTVVPPALELLLKVEVGLGALWNAPSETDVRCTAPRPDRRNVSAWREMNS